jgi:hypothetical protein
MAHSSASFTTAAMISFPVMFARETAVAATQLRRRSVFTGTKTA